MKELLPVAFIAALFLLSCKDEDNNKGKYVNKNGSIEVTLHTNHIDSLKDLMTTHYVIWSKGTKVKEFDVRDTIPSLGHSKTDVENDKGDSQTVNIPKDYDFYVTVK